MSNRKQGLMMQFPHILVLSLANLCFCISSIAQFTFSWEVNLALENSVNLLQQDTHSVCPPSTRTSTRKGAEPCSAEQWELPGSAMEQNYWMGSVVRYPWWAKQLAVVINATENLEVMGALSVCWVQDNHSPVVRAGVEEWQRKANPSWVLSYSG